MIPLTERIGDAGTEVDGSGVFEIPRGDGDSEHEDRQQSAPFSAQPARAESHEDIEAPLVTESPEGTHYGGVEIGEPPVRQCQVCGEISEELPGGHGVAHAHIDEEQDNHERDVESGQDASRTAVEVATR